jgi:HEPN domain-containing protein
MSAAAEWLRTAEVDLDGVRRALLPLPAPNLELGAYHCQQAAEKLVKALLVALGLVYPRGGSAGHDIGLAVRRIPDTHPLREDAAALIALTPWATAFRYPAEDPATAAQPPAATELAVWLARLEALRDRVAAMVPLEPEPP